MAEIKNNPIFERQTNLFWLMLNPPGLLIGILFKPTKDETKDRRGKQR